MATRKAPELGLKGPGVEPVVIDAVDHAIERYVEVRDERMELTRKEVTAKGALILTLRANKDKIGTDKDGAIVYRHDSLLVTLRHGEDELSVKTTKKKDKENGDGTE